MLGQRTQGQRRIDKYDPAADAAERHKEWTIRLAPLFGLGEVVDLPRKLILIDPEKRGDRYATAHALAHLDLEHVSETGGGAFTAEEETDADWLARLRLDDPDPVDREPEEQYAHRPARGGARRYSGLIGRAVVLSFTLAVLALFLPGAPIFDGAKGGDSSAWATSPDVRQPSPLHCSLGCPGDSNSVQAMQLPVANRHPDQAGAGAMHDQRSTAGSVTSTSGSSGTRSTSKGGGAVGGSGSGGVSAGGSGGVQVTVPDLGETSELPNLPKPGDAPDLDNLPNLDSAPSLGDVHVDATIPPLGQTGQSELSVGVGGDQESQQVQVTVATDPISKLTGIG